jgi:hypothetical protein
MMKSYGADEGGKTALDGQTVLGLAVVFATLFGPVVAVLITRWIDDSRRLNERRLEVFRLLMSSRRALLSPERVKALNLVEIEFYGIEPVLNAHKEVMDHINTLAARADRWNDRQRMLMTKLLSEMAKVLNYDLQQLDVLEGGYYPQAFADIDLENQAMRRVLLEVLSGRRPLTVSPVGPTPPSPFPPPPAPPLIPDNKQ